MGEEAPGGRGRAGSRPPLSPRPPASPCERASGTGGLRHRLPTLTPSAAPGPRGPAGGQAPRTGHRRGGCPCGRASGRLPPTVATSLKHVPEAQGTLSGLGTGKVGLGFPTMAPAESRKRSIRGRRHLGAHVRRAHSEGLAGEADLRVPAGRKPPTHTLISAPRLQDLPAGCPFEAAVPSGPDWPAGPDPGGSRSPPAPPAVLRGAGERRGNNSARITDIWASLSPPTNICSAVAKVDSAGGARGY